MRRISIAFSALLLFWLGWWGWHQVRQPHPIKRLRQATPHEEALPPAVFSRMLQLKTTSWEAFDPVIAAKLCKTIPWIKQVTVHKAPAFTIAIDYTLRQPVALLYEAPEIALDDEGVAFPLEGVYTPKRLPMVHLGWEKLQPQSDIEQWAIVRQLLEKKGPWRLLLIDLSNAFTAAFGKRGITLLVEERERPIRWLLRLKTERWESQFAAFEKIRVRVPNRPANLIVDLRLGTIALMTEK